MAPAGSNGTILEQSHRHIIVAALIAAAAIAGAQLTRRVERPAPAQPGVPAGGLAWPIPPQEPRIVVEVLNATKRTGLARLAARTLRANGLDVVSIGDADSGRALTQIIVRRGSGEGARQVLRALNAGRISTDIDTLLRVDITVLIGEDFRPVGPLHP